MGAGCSRPPMGNSVACSIEVKLPYPPQKKPGRRHTADVSGGSAKDPDVLPGRACAMGRPCRTSFSFAVCSGIRYAESLECTNGWQQRHEHALGKFRNACRHWTMRKEDLSFALSLGNITETGSEGDIAAVLRGVDQLSRIFPNYHAFGQSEAAAESKKGMLARLGLEGTYYSRKLPCDWRLIVLDTNQACQPASTSTMGIMSPKEGVGIGAAQLEWLKSELEMAEDAGERVMVAAHDPLVPGCAAMENCVGDSVAVAEVLFGSKSTNVVLCSGDHAGQYYEENGVHFLGITSMVTGPCATIIPYCIMKIEEGEVLGVRGFGGHRDRVIELKLEWRKSRPFRSLSFSWGEPLKKCIHESSDENKIEFSFSQSVV